MSESICFCKVCSTAIQQYTAERTGGMCMPCLSGGKVSCVECSKPMVRQSSLPVDQHVCIPCMKKRHISETKEILRNGVSMTPDWAANLDAAQKIKTVAVHGKRLRRVPWDNKSSKHLPTNPCGDCAALPGELHVPGCDVEQCPACDGQLISCGCMDKRKTTKRRRP